jgi:hypothetical protein
MRMAWPARTLRAMGIDDSDAEHLYEARLADCCRFNQARATSMTWSHRWKSGASLRHRSSIRRRRECEPNLRARWFVESFDHAVAGTHETFPMPRSLYSCRRERGRASQLPCSGSLAILQGILGLSNHEIDGLVAREVIGDPLVPSP